MEYFVATNGNDQNQGSKDAPFLTLARAQQAAREAIASGDAATVTLRGGRYRFYKTFAFAAEDSGKPHAPTVYRACPGEAVSICGGQELPPSAFDPVTDEAVLSRLPEAARGKVYACDLAAQGISDLGEEKQHGFSCPVVPSGLEVSVNGRMYQPARWPKDDYLPLGEIVDAGSSPRDGDFSDRPPVFRYDDARIGAWQNASDIWVSGFFAVGYADDNIRVAAIDPQEKTVHLASPHLYPMVSGKNFLKYYFYNVFEELSREGEYYLDRENAVLYLYSEAPPQGDILVSMLEEPLFALENASYITLSGFTIEASRGMGVYIEQGQCCTVENCVIRNLGEVGVSIGRGVENPDWRPEGPIHNFTGKLRSRWIGNLKAHLYDNMAENRMGGFGHRIVGCEVYGTGAGALLLGGGDRKTLTPSGFLVEDCSLHDCARREKTYKPAVWLDGVGHTVRHCEIYNMENVGVSIYGNDHIVEWNEIHHCVTSADDMGAVYAGRNQSELGNVIRFNYFHHNDLAPRDESHGDVAGTQSIFWDDGEIGLCVYGNVFYRAGSDSAVKSAWGRFGQVYGNLFIDTRAALCANGDVDFYINPQETWSDFQKKRLLEDVNLFAPPYSERYPELRRLRGAALSTNVFADNVIVHCPYVGEWYAENWTKTNNLILDGCMDFIDAPNGDFTLREDSIILQKMPGFLAADCCSKAGRKSR